MGRNAAHRRLFTYRQIPSVIEDTIKSLSRLISRQPMVIVSVSRKRRVRAALYYVPFQQGGNMNSNRDYRGEMKSLNLIGQQSMARLRGEFSRRPPRHELVTIV